MTNPKIRDAQAAVQILRKRLDSSTNGVEHVVVGHALATIEAGLLAASEAPAKSISPPATMEPKPTLGALESEVIRTVLEYRRVRNRLLAFNASSRTQARELTAPLAAFDAAVEKLASTRDEATQQRTQGQVSNG